MTPFPQRCGGPVSENPIDDMTYVRALPASLIGVAMIGLLNRPGPPGWLYTSLGGLVWLYAALFFPFAYKTLQPAWGHVDGSLLDEAVQRAIFAESLHEATSGRSTAELNRQSAEILKFIAESL